jgi:hypothetical protein
VVHGKEDTPSVPGYAAAGFGPTIDGTSDQVDRYIGGIFDIPFPNDFWPLEYFVPCPRENEIFRLTSSHRPEQIVGREEREELGLKARNLIAWVGASPTSAGPGNSPPHYYEA